MASASDDRRKGDQRIRDGYVLPSISLVFITTAQTATRDSSTARANRIIRGIFVDAFLGLTSATGPVYQAECSKPRIRGKLVVVGSLTNTAAFCLANWINYGLYFQSGPLQWRFPLGFQLIFPVVVFIAILFVPESPRWLLLKDRHDEALQVIARLAGKNVSIHDPEVTAEFLSIQSALQLERKDRVPVKDVLLCKDKTQNFRRLLLSMGTQFMQQFSGVNALGKNTDVTVKAAIFPSTNH